MPDVYARRFDLFPPAAAGASWHPDTALLDALDVWLGDLDEPVALTFDGSVAFRRTDGHVLRWEPWRTADRAFAELTRRWSDPADPDVQWFARVTYLRSADGVRARLRVAGSRKRKAPGTQEPGFPGLPRIVPQLAARFRARVAGHICRSVPTVLRTADIDTFVRYELLGPERTIPYLVLSPDAEGRFLLPPDRFVEEFLSLGALFVVETPSDTFALTDALGRRELSCFHGALRAYRPDMEPDDDPLRHPLLLSRRVGSPDDRHRLATWLASETTVVPFDDAELDALREEWTQAADRAREEQERARPRDTASGDDEWREIAASYAEENDRLRAENEELRKELTELQEWRAILDKDLTDRGVDVRGPRTATPTVPEDVAEAVEMAQLEFSDALLFLPSVDRSAADSPFGRPVEVFEALRALASVASRMRAGPLGTSLAEALKAKGQDYASGISRRTSKKLRQQYVFRDGDRDFVCEEHLRLGGATYDPRTVARIYFTSGSADVKAADGRIVVGHVGRHLDVTSTT